MFSVAPAAPAFALDTSVALDFFGTYRRLSASLDEGVADLYSDDARITVRGVYPDGQSSKVSMTGAQLKSVLPRVLREAKFRGDTSEYSNVEASPLGESVKIKADRYSALKKYTDREYYMVVSEQPDGSIAITEEYSEARPQTLPGGEIAGDDLQSQMRLLESRMTGLLPMMVDEDTRLDSVSASGDRFSFHYTLAETSGDELDNGVFSALMQKSMSEHACSEPGLRRLLSAGGTLEFVYVDRDATPVARFALTSADCGMVSDPEKAPPESATPAR